MKATTVVVIAMMVRWAGAASAAGPADDAQAVAQCVDTAEASDQFPGACIGIVADPCIKAAGTPDAAKACAKRELAVWRVRMTKAIALIGKGGPKQMAPAVAAAQRSLAAGQDSLCPQFKASIRACRWAARTTAGCRRQRAARFYWSGWRRRSPNIESGVAGLREAKCGAIAPRVQCPPDFAPLNPGYAEPLAAV
jgi:hypothetical protein